MIFDHTGKDVPYAKACVLDILSTRLSQYGPFADSGHMVHAGGQAAHWDIQNKENLNLSWWSRFVLDVPVGSLPSSMYHVTASCKRPIKLLYGWVTRQNDPCNQHKGMSTRCWIAFYTVVKNTSAWCERKWPKTAAIFRRESNPRSSRSILCSHYSRKCHGNLSDTCMWQFTFKTEEVQVEHHSDTKSIWNRRFVCERRPFPICFRYRHKSCKI